MRAKVVAILETRTGAHLAAMIERLGGIAMLAPALEEVPDVQPQAVADVLTQWRINPFTMVIFQTGVGTRALFQATDLAESTEELLRLLKTSVVVVRGPKPVGVLNARQVRIDIRAASPFTTDTVLEAVSDLSTQGARVLVQRFGAENQRLREALEARGASVQEIATYRWALPSDVQPLVDLLDALVLSRVAAVVFTSAIQVRNLYAVAAQTGRSTDLAERLNRLVIASIGPVCSRELREHGIRPSFEANPPKLGPLIAALDAAMSSG